MMTDNVSQSPEKPHRISRALDNGLVLAAIKLDDSEVSLLLSGGPANVSNIDSSAQSIEIADYEQRSRSPEEEEFDNDYVLETPEESDPKPIQIDITKLKSAGKKRRNDYAPAERGSKKAKTTAIGYVDLLMRDENREK